MSDSTLNLRKELQRGALVYKAFEHGLELADKLKTIEEQITIRQTEVAKLDKVLEIARENHSVEMKKLEDGKLKRELEIISEIATNTKDVGKKLADAEKELSEVCISIDKLKEKEKELSGSIADKQFEIAQKEESLEALNEKIKEAKKKMEDFLSA